MFGVGLNRPMTVIILSESEHTPQEEAFLDCFKRKTFLSLASSSFFDKQGAFQLL